MSSPTSAAYIAPDNPADPEAAALELLVQTVVVLLEVAIGGALPDDNAILAGYRHFAGVLDLECAFAGMSWHDARHAAVAIGGALVVRDDPAAFLHLRAVHTASGVDNMTWDDRDSMVRAFTVGATVVAL